MSGSGRSTERRTKCKVPYVVYSTVSASRLVLALLKLLGIHEGKHEEFYGQKLPDRVFFRRKILLLRASS